MRKVGTFSRNELRREYIHLLLECGGYFERRQQLAALRTHVVTEAARTKDEEL